MKKTTTKKFICILLLVVVTISFSRWLLIISSTETGLEVCIFDFRESTLGLLGLEQPPIDFRSESKQAQYWLQESARIVDAHPDDPRYAIGASWVLNSLRSNLRFWNQLPSEGKSFKSICLEKSIYYADKAIELAPGDVNWRRLRAILDYNPSSKHQKTDSWKISLNDHALVDSKNALYDYLIAAKLWSESSELQNLEEGYRLDFTSPQNFQEGTLHFERGLQKEFIAVSEEDAMAAVLRFLDESLLSKKEKLELAISRDFVFRKVNLIRHVLLELAYQLMALDNEDHKSISVNHKQRLRVIEQSVFNREMSSLDVLAGFSGTLNNIYRDLSKIAENHPEVLTEDDITRLQESISSWKVPSEKLMEYLFTNDISHSIHPDDRSDSKAPLNNWSLLAVVTRIMFTGAIWSLLLGGVGIVISRTILPSKNIGNLKSSASLLIVAWLIGYAFTFIVLGLAPTAYISGAFQEIVFYLFSLIMVLAISFCLSRSVYRCARNGRTHAMLKYLFLLISFLLIVFSGGFLLLLNQEFYPIIPERNVYSIQVPQLHHKFGLWDESWKRVIFQWWVYGGIVWATIIALLIYCAQSYVQPFLCWLNLKRKNSTEDPIHTSHEQLLGYIFLSSRSAIILSFVYLTFYLLLSPTVIQETEDDYQRRMQYCRDPKGYYQKFYDLSHEE